jgi:flavin-dependent dehydrogenase
VTRYDAIVIGGGPAGSTVAARLAQKKRSVVLFEKERFPRFHIGESLLPACVPLLDELGVHDQVRAKFLRKNAAEFVTADGSVHRRYTFDQSLLGEAKYAYEVDRASFDGMLLENAQRLGVDVRQGVQVKDFSTSSSGVEVTTDGKETLKAEYLIDASGQSALVAKRFGQREMDQELKNFAVFAHYTGAERHSGDREGDITIVLGIDHWWWVIPLTEDRTSIGLVGRKHFLRGQKPDTTYFDAQLSINPVLKKRFQGATRVQPVRTISDYSYACQNVVGDRWLLVGDAAAFLDPVFSTGVCLGMLQGFRAADAVDGVLAGANRRQAFGAYARYQKASVGTFRKFVRGFYTPELVELLMAPSDSLELRRAVTTLLSGQGVERFPIAWRITLFRSLARLNRVLRLAPRLPGIRGESSLYQP